MRKLFFSLIALAGLRPKAGGESPDGAPHVCVDRDECAPGGAANLGGLNGTLWEPGRVLHVKFLDGTRIQRDRAFAAISAWSKVCNIAFVHSDAKDAEIRVTFRPGASWSMIGRGCLQVPLSQPTMQLGWLRDDTPEAEYYVATHEAGHAIGFIHGQNLPNADIRWDLEKVYRYYSGPPNFWDRRTIFDNVVSRFGEQAVSHGPFDERSIMQYPVDPQLTLDGRGIGWNKALSEGDAAFARRAYPFPGDSRPIAYCPHPSNFLIQEDSCPETKRCRSSGGRCSPRAVPCSPTSPTPPPEGPSGPTDPPSAPSPACC